MLSIEAVAVAVSGQEPGTLGLYELDWGGWSNSAAGPIKGAAAVYGTEQQQQSLGGKVLRLYHQWSLKSCPKSIWFMSSSQLELLDGKRVAAAQVSSLTHARTGPIPTSNHASLETAM
jgi:hypothetical protein